MKNLKFKLLLAASTDPTGIVAAMVENNEPIERSWYNEMIRKYRAGLRHHQDALTENRKHAIMRYCEKHGMAKRVRGGRYVDHQPSDKAMDYYAIASVDIDFWNAEAQYLGAQRVEMRHVALWRRAWEALRDATENECGKKSDYDWNVTEACRIGHIIDFKGKPDEDGLRHDYDVVIDPKSGDITLVREFWSDGEQVNSGIVYSKR